MSQDGPPAASPAGRPEAEVSLGPLGLRGSLAPPEPGRGLVLFAHGSGSGRLSPRNRLVAAGLREAGLGTLLFDLLREEEAEDRRNVFDIPLLAERLVLATGWARGRPELQGAPIGYFGASTGAGAALLAATLSPHPVGAIVSRGGRPDLAGAALAQVRAPTLLIVGALDEAVIGLNQRALAAMGCEKELVLVPGAGHLFEEPGTLERVVELARGWFAGHLGAEG